MKVIPYPPPPPPTKNLDAVKSPENRDVLFLHLWMRFRVKYALLYISLRGESS